MTHTERVGREQFSHKISHQGLVTGREVHARHFVDMSPNFGAVVAVLIVFFNRENRPIRRHMVMVGVDVIST